MKKFDEIYKNLEKLFEDKKMKEAELFLLDCIKEAEDHSDKELLLQLYNELIGYYRELSRKDDMLKAIEYAFALTDELHMTNTLPYATTLLNAANGYRAFGALEKSKEYYEIAEKIYTANLPEDDMLMAGLYNNFSLLYQEQADYKNALQYLQKALQIVTKHDAKFEIAVTFANLANTAVMAKEYDRAQDYARKAIRGFQEINTFDAHYCAAFSALGMCFFYQNDYLEAAKKFETAMGIVESLFGKNTHYQRLKENYDLCIAQLPYKKVRGLSLCKAYYETYGAPLIREKFPEYENRIAVGLVGEGSDCFRLDDEISRDHDWGPGFCLWLDDETYEEIGEALEKAYEELPVEFEGYKRTVSKNGQGRRGVCKISAFYKRILGENNYPEINWESVEDYALATASNGEVFRDDCGIFTAFRDRILKGYPENIRFLKLAEDAAFFCQSGQYNYFRQMQRKDVLSADRMLSDCIGYAMKMQHHIYNCYPPHEKWLLQSVGKLPNAEILVPLLYELHSYLNVTDEAVIDKVRNTMEKLGAFFARELYDTGAISDIDSYLDVHCEELQLKAFYAAMSSKELVMEIAKTEFKAFDKVKNEGGRASCQNDWPTFSIMRRSQYLTWNRTMLLQYLYDFKRELRLGHNLITEKYGRMMESTAPKEYDEIKDNFPAISDEKKAVIEQIVEIQMGMAEDFAKVHPKVAVNARSLHTYEDSIINTSYETYLRGEISTYSDKMLQLYAGYVVDCFKEKKNIAEMTIENTAKLYGYANIREFENSIE